MLECATGIASNVVPTPSHPADSDTAATIVALTGFMGSGKTTIGSALAEMLGWRFVDLDGEIERQEQTPIRQLFRERGEAEFRSAERAALRTCLAQRSRATVLALGGGTFVQRENVEALRARGALMVFLETPVDEMLQRCGVGNEPDSDNPRPLAAEAAAFRRLYEERLPLYRAADLTINTSGKAVEEVASEIVESLQLSAWR